MPNLKKESTAGQAFLWLLGYHGSSLDYGDIDIMSNGALLGLTKNYYRKNFWTALTMAGNIGLGKSF